ncbi:unnamed protein product [Ectocarpus sp. 12 AP-2014]
MSVPLAELEGGSTMTTTINKRTRLGVALFAVVNAHFSVQRVGAFAVRSCARCKRPRPTMTADSPPLSRAQLLRAVPVLVGVAAFHCATPAEPARAALPTTEDYAFGTGSKTSARASASTQGQESKDPCPDCSLSERRKRAASSSAVQSSPSKVKRPEVQDELSAPLPKSSVNPDNPVEVVRAASGELDRMQTLVNKERWGDALTRLRSFPLTALKSPTLGMKSVGDVARALGVSNSKASDILEASMEAGLTLREVEDVVFSNTRTLEFFNSADYKQVEDLAKDRTPTDLTEPLQLLSDTKKLVGGVADLMGAPQ